MGTLLTNMVDIHSLIAQGENSRMEAKKAAGGIPDSLWETYSAFANTEGGVILLGVSEIDEKLVITGVKDVQKKIKLIWDTLNDRNKISVNVLMEKHVYAKEIDGLHVIVIEVPRADRHDKPVYLGKDVFSGSYRRNYEGDYHCTYNSVRAMLRDQSDFPVDSKVFSKISWKDLDVDTIRRYRNHFSSLKPSHIWNGLDLLEFLKKTGAVRKDDDGHYCPSLAGLVFFGTEDIITQIFPDYFLDYREKQDNNRWSDRVVSNLGEWSGNIFDFFFKVAGKLTADVKRPFMMRNNLEREDDSPVHKAIREAFANSLIHADYSGRQGIVIEKSKNEIKIINPGICRPDIKEVKEGGVSDPRNPSIFRLFAMIDIGERAGCGVYNICSVWKEMGWKEPSLIEKFNPDQTVVVLPLELNKKNNYLYTYDEGNKGEFEMKNMVSDSVVEYVRGGSKGSLEKSADVVLGSEKISLLNSVGSEKKPDYYKISSRKRTDGRKIGSEKKTDFNLIGSEKNYSFNAISSAENPHYHGVSADWMLDGYLIGSEKNLNLSCVGSEKSSNLGRNGSEKTSVLDGIGSEKPLRKSSEKIIDIIKNNPLVTIEILSGELKITTRAVEKNLSKLKIKGLIERIGPDKGGCWKINQSF